MISKTLYGKEARDAQLSVKKRRDGIQPEVFDLTLFKMNCIENGDGEIPHRVTLTLPNPNEKEGAQLFIDRFPVPDELWEYDSGEKVLRWNRLYGGGSLNLMSVGNGGYGMVGKAGEEVSVRISSTASFLCDAASGCGIKYIVSPAGKNMGFKWDTESTEWQGAEWQKGRLQLEYTVTSGTPMDPPEYSFKFTDFINDDDWKPLTCDAALQVGAHKGLPVWQLTFRSSDSDPMGSLFPSFMEAEEDMAAYRINGVMEVIDEADPKKKNLYGIKGIRANAMVTGYYKAEEGHRPFSVFDGNLYIDGKWIEDVKMQGSRLNWKGLSSRQQEITGLAETGSLTFSPDGLRILPSDGGLLCPMKEDSILKVGTEEALNYVMGSCDDLDSKECQLFSQLKNNEPDTISLLSMTSFEQDENGGWFDVIQKRVSNDMTKIINDSIPNDMWKMLFPDKKKPAIEDYLSEIKSMQVEKQENPSEWYGKLGVAVLSSVMAGGAQESCKLLNGNRASQWMRMQTTTSPIYYAHSQELFHYHWRNKYLWMEDYFKDQSDNWVAKGYEKQIKDRTEKSKKDIDEHVIEPATNPPKQAADGEEKKDKPIKDILKEQLEESCAHAIEKRLYWAFAYYTYNTAPAVLTNIAFQISISTGSGDGMSLTRMIQQNVSVLTALDKSGYFANKYVETINAFLTTNILTTMFDFSGAEENFDLLKTYIEKMFELYKKSSDKEISDAMKALEEALNKEGKEVVLREAVEFITHICKTTEDIMAFPFIAKSFVQKFRQNHPNMSLCAETFSTMMFTGLGALAIYNIITACKNWKDLTEAERAEIIIGATELGIQFIAAVVKRGVRTYAIFKADGLTSGQRLCGVSKVLASGRTAEMDCGLIKMGNSFARWLADTQGTLGKTAVLNGAGAMVNTITNNAQHTSWVTKVCGSNMEEFVATRLGPLIILASIGFSIYHLTGKLTEMEKASESLNIVSGALMLFAIAGEWAVSAGAIAAGSVLATILSAAGFLGIIAAVVGIILLICEMFKAPPDPVKDFIKKYGEPAGFALDQPCGSLDYAKAYIDSDQGNLLIVGFRIIIQDQAKKGEPQKVLAVDSAGTIALPLKTEATFGPESVLQTTTDEFGRSKIFTAVKDDKNESVKYVYLSCMEDNSIKFCETDEKKVKNQHWYGTMITTILEKEGRSLKGGYLLLRSVVKNADGSYQAGDFLTLENSQLICKPKPNPVIFTLSMSGMTPSFMRMKNLKFTCGKVPYESAVYGPNFGVIPSTPCTFTLTGSEWEYVNNFLSFDKETGKIKPIKNRIPSTRSIGDVTMQAKNSLGSAEVSFQINVE